MKQEQETITKTIDETLLIPILGKGKKLYHYTSAAGLQGICSGEFWVTERSFLNDTMEFQVATKIFCEVIDKKRLVSLEALESVMIGPKNKSDIAEKGLQYFFRNRKMDVKIHKSQMPIRY